MALRDLSAEDRQRLESPEGLRELLSRYGGVRATARALHICHTLIIDRLDKFGLRSGEIVKGAVVYENRKKQPTEDDVDAFLQAMTAAQEAAAALDTKQVELSLEIRDTKPVAVSFWSDWHLGGRGVDYQGHDEDARLIEETPGLYWFGGGDYKDNYNPAPHPTGCNGQVFPPGTQDLVVLRYMRRCGKRCLALLRGCHDQWDHANSDRDFVAACCEAADAANLWHGGLVHLWIGQECYDIRARHKYPGESNLNTTNTHRRQIEADGEADIYARAHRHYPDIQMVPKAGRSTVVFLRSGSRKIWDEYGQQNAGGAKGQPGIPTVVLFPNEHKMVPFRDIRDAIPYLRAVR